MISLSQSWKGFLKWKRGLTSEQIRRFTIRLTTTLLIAIIGPAMAWHALEMEGILLYLFFNTIAKYTSSKLASINTKIANFAYRWTSIIALLFAALLGILVNLFELQIFIFTSQIPPLYVEIIVCGIIPLLLGIFEGSFWASFLGILAAATERKRLEEKKEEGKLDVEQYERLINIPMTLDFEQDIKKNGAEHPGPDGKTAKRFQLNEVLATVSVAMLIWFMDLTIDDNYVKLLSCIIGLVLIIIAISLPIGKNHLDNDRILIRRDRSPLKEDKDKRTPAKIISGIFGIMQLSVAWSMKIFAFSHGGVVTLAIFLAIAELVGFGLVDILPKCIKKFEYYLEKKPQSVWRIGHYLSLSGITIMAWGAVEDSKLIFLFGWCLSQGAIRGMLRGREIIFSNQHLQCKPIKNDEIGLRERTKFTMHLQYVFVIICCFWLYSYIGYTAVNWVIAIMLFWGALCAMVELAISYPIIICGRNVQLVPRQLEEHKD